MKNLKLNSIDVSALKSIVDKIILRLDNSVNIIDEMGGPESFYIHLDTLNNAIVPIKTDQGLSQLEQYTNADYAGIYETYIEGKSFNGMYSISSEDEARNWSLSFHGSSKEDETGDLKEDERKLITETLNPKSIFLIADEVLKNCR